MSEKLCNVISLEIAEKEKELEKAKEIVKKLKRDIRRLNTMLNKLEGSQDV